MNKNENAIAVLSSNSHQAGLESVTGSIYSVGLSDLRHLIEEVGAIENQNSEKLLSEHLKTKFGSEDNLDFSNFVNKKREDTPEILLSEISIGVSEGQDSELFPIEGNLFEVIIAPFFGPRAVSKAAQHKVILVPQPIQKIKWLKKLFESEENLTLEVNLKNQCVSIPGFGKFRFETHPWLRTKLLLGLDNMDEMKLYESDFNLHLDEDKKKRPWLYDKE